MKEKNHVIIAIGASAGGLEALQEFILNIPPKMVNISVIIAQHLSPTHKSMLVQLLSRETKKRIVEAQDQLEIEPDVIYITPPDKDITVKESKMVLSKPKSSLGPKPSVDLLFQSLAQSKYSNVVGVILSGTGSDGAKGAQVLKQAGGYIIAQEPKTAKYDGMPMSVIQTGIVDLVLSPDKMASEIMEYMLNPLNKSFSEQSKELTSDPLNEIIKLLSNRVGTNFEGYKIGTISRRLQKRLELIGKRTYQEYLEYVTKHPEELDEMFKYALIGVTGFFRDPESFSILQNELTKLFESKKPQDTVRIWVPGCSTGEEAFTIAIIINEILKDKISAFNIRIFATDIDQEAINQAKRGIYATAQIENVPEKLKSKYFTKKGKSYEISKHLRNIILFSKHDLTKNPPFLKLDLISCRNLMIYFGNDLQKYLIPIFHYSLNHHGLLFLGKSETVGQFTQLFSTVDGKNKIYQRKIGEGVAPVRFQAISSTSSINNAYRQQQQNRPLTISERVRKTLVNTFEHPYVVVDKDFIIHEIKGDHRLFLSLKTGVAQLNLIKLVNEELQIELRSLLSKAIKGNQSLSSDIKRFSLFGREHYVRFKIKPLEENFTDQYYIVIFEELDLSGIFINKTEVKDHQTIENERVIELEYELTATKEHLQTYIEEIETSNEELQSLNEEMQSTNEELQSSNEELETTNEELQSTNEEMQIAYNELRQVHSQLEIKENIIREKEHNHAALLDNTLQAFYLINADFNILSFNSVADELAHKLRNSALNSGDSFLKLVSSDNMHIFLSAVKKVFDGETVTGEILEHNFKGEKIWLLFSLTPVKSATNRIESITIGILDITDKKNVSQKLTSTERLLHSIFDAAVTGICITDHEGIFVDVNQEYCNIYGYEKEELIGKHFSMVVPEQFKMQLSELNDKFISGEEELDAEWMVQKKDGSTIDIFAKAQLLVFEDGKRYKITSIKDITESKKYHNMLTDSEYEHNIGGWEFDNLSQRLEWTDEVYRIFKQSTSIQLSLYSMAELFDDEASVALKSSFEAALEDGKPFDLELEYISPMDETIWVRVSCKPLRVYDRTVRLYGTVQDVTNKKREQAEIVSSRERYKATFENSMIGFAITKPDGTIIEANSALLTMLGYSKEELFKLGRKGLIDESSTNFKKLFEIRSKTGKTKGELYFIKKDGSKILCEIYSALYETANGEVYASNIINDISEKEKADQLFKSISENLPGVFYRYVLKPDGSNEFGYMSEGSMKMLSIPAKDILTDSSTVWNRIHKDDLDLVIESVKTSAEKLEQWSSEFRFMHPDGSIRWHRGSGIPSRKENGDIVWDSMIVDVTKEKENQQKLEEINKKILALFEDVDGISVQGYDKNGDVKYWNAASEKLYGYSRDEALGKKLWDLIIPEFMRNDVKSHVLEMIRTGKGTPSEELMLKHKNGNLVPVLSSHTVIAFSNEEVMLFCMDVDLSEVKRTKQALSESEVQLKERTEMIELLMNSTAEAIYGINEQGICTFVNQSCIKLLGYDNEEELLGKNIHEAIHHTTSVGKSHELNDCEIHRSVSFGESKYVAEDIFWTKNGEPVPVEYWSYPVFKNEKPVGAVVTFFDITEKKEQRKKIEETLKILSDYKFALDESANIVITDANGIILEVNENTCKLSGYSREELIGSHTKINKSGFHPDSFYDEMWNTISNGRVWRGEIKNIDKNDNHYWVDTTIVPFIGTNGKPEKYLAIRFDITEEKKSKELIENNQKRFEALVQNSSDYFCIVNEEGKYVYLSPSYEDAFGSLTKESTNIDPYSMIHELDIDTVNEAFSKALNSKNIDIPPYRFKFINKGWRWIESKVTDYRDNPVINGFILNSFDITDKLIFTELDETERIAFKEYTEGKSIKSISNKILKEFEFLFPEIHAFMITSEAELWELYTSERTDFSHFLEKNIAQIRNMKTPTLHSLLTGEKVIIEDIHSEPDWSDFQEFANQHEITSLWNYPVVDAENKLLCLIGFGSSSPRLPDHTMQRVINRLIELLRILYENASKDQALKTINQRFEYANRATQDTVFDWDLNTNQVEWGHHFEAFFGFEPESIESGPDEFLNLLHTADKEITNKAILESLANSSKYDLKVECRTIRPDGRIVYVLISAFILRNEDGSARSMIGAFRNITKTKQELIRAEFISTMNNFFSETEDISKACLNIIKTIVSKFELEYGEIWIKSDQNEILKQLAIYSHNEDIQRIFESSKIELGINEGMPGAVWNTKEPVFWDDLTTNDHFIRRDSVKRSKLHVGIGIPLVYQNEIQGVLLMMAHECHNPVNILEVLNDLFSTAFGAVIKRKKIENELSTFFNSSPDILCIASFDGYFKKINPSASELLGYSQEELLTRPFTDFVHPDDLEKTTEEKKEMVDVSPTFGFENRYVTKSGEIKWLLWNSTVVHEEGLIYSVAKDVTDKKIAESKLLEKTKQLATIAKVNASLINYEDWLSSFANAMKYIGETLGSDRAYIFKKLTDQTTNTEMIRMQYEWCSEGTEAFIENEKIARLPFDIDKNILVKLSGGEVLSIHIKDLPEGEFKSLSEMQEIKSCLVIPIFSKREFWGLLGVDYCRKEHTPTNSEIEFLKTLSLNISAAIESYESKEDVVISNKRFEMVSKATNDAIWEFETNKDDLIWNEVFWDLFGYNPNEVPSTFEFWKSLLHVDDKDRVLQSLNKHLDNKASFNWEAEYRFKRADGSYAYVYDRGSVIRDEEGNALRMVGAMQDISSRKEYEESLKKLNQELQDTIRELEMSNTDLEQFAFVASHDLQEPLRMITSFLTQLERKYEHLLDEKGKKYIYFATDGAKRMRQIILDLLDFSRVGRIDSEITLIDMNQVINEVITMNQRYIRDRKAEIIFDGLPIVSASKTLMTQVFQNLIVNAVKYQLPDSTPKIAIESEDVGTHWQFKVIDNGIGINQEYKEKIFNIFQRLHGKDEYSGTGVGLAISKKAIEYHQGKIWVEENPLGGSIFMFTLKKDLKVV